MPTEQSRPHAGISEIDEAQENPLFCPLDARKTHTVFVVRYMEVNGGTCKKVTIAVDQPSMPLKRPSHHHGTAADNSALSR